MSTHRVFLYNPSRPGSRIAEVEAEVAIKPKCTWALYRGKQHLLGSTAFYSLAAANRAKRGALQKVIDTPVLDRIAQTMNMRKNAMYQLAFYEAKGEFPLAGRLH